MADTVVEFGAKTDELDKGTAHVHEQMQALNSSVASLSQAMSAAADDMGSAFDKLGEDVGKVNELFKGLTETINKGGSTLSTGWMKLLFGGAIGAAAAGTIAAFHAIEEEFLKMDRSAREAGVSLQKFQELQYALNQSGAGSDKMVEGLNEASKKLNELTHDSGELGKFLDANNVKWKDSSGHIIDMNRYLEVSAQLIANASTQGDRFKAGELLGFSKEWVRVLQGGPAAIKQLADEAIASGAVIDSELIKRSADFEREWNKSSLAWATFFKSLIVSLTPYIEGLINGFSDVIERFRQHWHDTVNDAIEKQTVDSLHIVGAAFDGMQVAKPFEELAERMKSFAAVSTVASGDWKAIADNAKRMSNDLARVAEDTFATGSGATKFPKDDDKDKGADSAKMTALNQQLDEWREYYAKLKVYEKSAVDSFKETEGQKTANLLAALTQREAAEKAIYEKEIAAAGDNAGKVAAIKRKEAKEIEAIDKERMAIEAEQLKKSTQEWESAVNSITGAFNSQLKGLLAHTTSWAQAMRNIAASLVMKIIEEFEKIAIVKPLTQMLASSFSAPTELFQGLIKAVSATLGPLTAGFTSFFAPTLGPAAPAAGAAAAGAEVAAATSLVGKFESGTDYVPQTGLALVHQGERIIPASQNAAGGGVSPASQFAFNVQALDSTGVQAFFNRYGPQIARTLSAHMQQNASFT